jgi:methionine sulfoxide reductase catalytic subunit
MRWNIPRDLKSSAITDETVYRSRRDLLKSGAALGASGLFGNWFGGDAPDTEILLNALPTWPPLKSSPLSTADALNRLSEVATYNNFYEFGTGKDDPAAQASTLRVRPWHVVIEGEVAKPGVFALEDLIKPHTLEERIYHFRCVETWSAVIPWVGFSLGELLKRFEPTSRAKYVAFTTLHDPEQMPGQRLPVLDWPYVEGLRMDEAVHPLTILAVGMYGRWLPNQNGAPIRLVVPWKYGYKSIKSIVRIRLQEQQPPTTWNRMSPEEYGFYSNVNPAVDHPRWSQKRERRLGELSTRETLPFNGYAEHVAKLYNGMDLSRASA